MKKKAEEHCDVCHAMGYDCKDWHKGVCCKELHRYRVKYKHER